MRKNVMYKNIIYTLVTVGCMFLFVMLFCSKASAGVEISDQESHVTYKQVMVHEGESLSQISAEYAARFSGMSSSQYMDQIIYLNDLHISLNLRQQFLRLFKMLLIYCFFL